MYINIRIYIYIIRTPSDPYLFRFDPYNDGVNPPQKDVSWVLNVHRKSSVVSLNFLGLSRPFQFKLVAMLINIFIYIYTHVMLMFGNL